MSRQPSKRGPISAGVSGGQGSAASTRRAPTSGGAEERQGDEAPGSVQSLLLGLRVLEAVVSSTKERGISELAAELGMNKWRIFRYLHSLRAGGYVVQDSESGKFRAGRRSYSLFRSLMARFNIVNQARSEMLALRGILGHTVVLTAPVDDASVVVVDTLEGLQAIEFVFKLGATFDLHSSAHGKLALAFGQREMRERLLQRELHRFTEYTITDPVLLSRELDRIRQQRWASAAEENYRGMSAIAAPILSVGNEFMGSIGVIGSVDLLPHEPNPQHVEAVVSAARNISMKLGWNI